ncbi:TPA: hypothetical protein DDZ86_05235 [Candidatus Dependentiae bacterium]|nr:hypothetical protein [Candidatus Dependentiae bacterium]
MMSSSINTWFGITWAAPWYSLLIPVILVLIGMRMWYVLRRRALLKDLSCASSNARLFSFVSSKKEFARAALFFAGLVLLWVALLRPQWGVSEEKVVREGRDIVIALDISRSMLVSDCGAERLECAKAKVRRLIEMLGADRVGLVIFSGDALIQCPLTTDYEAFRMFLDDLTVETVSSGTTSLGAALSKVADIFKGGSGKKDEDAARKASSTRLALVFTDGEDFAGGIEAEKERMKSLGIHVCAVGVGSPEGAPVPVVDVRGVRVGFEKDKEGHVVISRLNEGMLRSLVDGVGLYVHAGRDERDVLQIKKWVERFEKRRFDGRDRTRLKERFYGYSAAALVLFVLELMI